MGILDKEIKRIKDEHKRVKLLLTLLGYSAHTGYILSDDATSFSATLMVELPDGNLYEDCRELITKGLYNSIEDKVFLDILDSWVESGRFIIVDDLGNPLNKEWKQELINAINKYNRGGMMINEFSK